MDCKRKKPMSNHRNIDGVNCARVMGVVLVASLCGGMPGFYQKVLAEDWPRVTPAVKVIESVQSTVVPIFTQTAPKSVGMGAGAVIHRSGFILTADHVTQNFSGVALFGLKRVPYEVVGRLPERDIAILRVDAAEVTTALPLGRSHDLKAGEPIIVGGNPSGRGIVFSQGVVSAPSIDPTWPNLLAKSFWRGELDQVDDQRRRSTGGRPEYIQFDATSNRGNSGGPMINLEGALIGLVTQKSFQEEGINWAIPVDRIRVVLPYLLQPEEMGGFMTGIEVDPIAQHAVIRSVEESSPGWNAGLRKDDVLTQVENHPVAGIDGWLIAIFGKKPGDKLDVTITRNGQAEKMTVTLVEDTRRKPVSAEDKQEGVTFRKYAGKFSALPDFSRLQPATTGNAKEISFQGVVKPDESNFALVYSGYLDFADAGLVRMSLGSDDGSKLYIHDQLVIDNDLLHPYQKLSKWVRVPKGATPFRIEYADAGGDKQISFAVTQDVDGKKPVPFRFLRDATPAN